MPLSEGQTFAGYRIVRLLGSGGMGEVYLARHPRLPRQDALKVLRANVSAEPDYRARFNREADLASKLWHPHIVSVHDRGEYDGQLWIAMDYVDGLDAARLLASPFPDGMPTDQVLRIISAVASALDYAHKQGLLHRDVKPANIMLTHLGDDEEEQRILLADFGIARNVDDISGLTATNMTVGTVAYSAPEQLMGEELDGRADEYALAATAYHLLTGSQLFPHSNPAVVISRHLNLPPPPLGDTRPELAALDPILARALAKNPDDRFPRCLDFARALEEPSSENGSPSPVADTKPAPLLPTSKPGVSQAPAAGEPPRRPAVSRIRRRVLIPAAFLAVILVAAVITLIWRAWDNGRSSPTAIASPSATASSPTSAPHDSSPPPPPVFSPNAIDTVLLAPTELNDLLGSYGTSATRGRVGLMKIDNSSYGMSDNSNIVTPPECVGVIFGAEHAVYADTGFEAVRDVTFTQESYVYDTTASAPNLAEQTVVVFPSADQAQAVLASSQKQWRSCAHGTVTRKLYEGADGYELGSVQLKGDVLTVSMVAINRESGDSACQQVLAARANVLVGTRACLTPTTIPVTATSADPNLAGDNAERLAQAMLAKVKS